MVFEYAFEKKLVRDNPVLVFFISLVYVFLAHIVAAAFFGTSTSIAMLFTLTLLLTPSFAHLLKEEEQREAKEKVSEGVREFFSHHKTAIYLYFACFLGIFFGFLLLGLFSPIDQTFSYQLTFLETHQQVSLHTIGTFLAQDLSPTFAAFFALLTDNLGVVVICFLLSLFYGSGSLFLVILNASIFSTFLLFLFEHLTFGVGEKVVLLLYFLIHLIPEILGFLLAAISGGVLSQAILSEKFRGKGFRNIMQHVAVFLVLAFFCITLGAFLEVYVSSSLVHGFLG